MKKFKLPELEITTDEKGGVEVFKDVEIQLMINDIKFVSAQNRFYGDKDYFILASVLLPNMIISPKELKDPKIFNCDAIALDELVMLLMNEQNIYMEEKEAKKKNRKPMKLQLLTKE